MTPRRKNMLEAFQDSTRASAPEPPAPRAPKSPSLFDRASDAPLQELPEPPARRRIEPVLAAAAGALLLVLSFFLGRLSVDTEVRAAEDAGATETAAGGFALPLDAPADDDRASDPPAANRAADTSDGATASGSADTDADRAFLSEENVVTVAAHRYGPNERTRWQQDYWSLRDAGLPVVRPVRERGGDHYVLCVGAEPALNDAIRALHAQVLAMGFDTAYVNNIDNLTARD